MEDEQLLQDTQTPDETLDDLGAIVENGELEADKLAETNKRLYARAKKAEEELKTLRGVPKVEAPKEVKLVGISAQDILELHAEGYTDKDILHLQKEASDLNVPIATLKNNETFKKGLATLQREAKTNASTPSTSQRSSGFSFKGKAYNELTNDADRREAFNARRSANNGNNE